MKVLRLRLLISFLIFVVIASVFFIQQAQREAGSGTDLKTFDTFSKNLEANILAFIKGLDLDEVRKAYQQVLAVQYLGQKAQVAPWPRTTAGGEIDSSTLEGQFIRLRLSYAQKAIQEFTGYNLTKNELPRIGVAFSGGGYRAMIFTSGFLKALEDIKLLDAIMYISTLSGSTWCLGPWTFLQKPDKKLDADLFRMLLVAKASRGEFNLLSTKTARGFSTQRFINQVLWPKFIFKQPFSSVDLYGGVLAHVLLNYFGNNRFDMHLSSQWNNIRIGQHPWPIYTAVSMHQENGNYRYNWYEFNPEYIINKSLKLCIPSFAFGRRFEGGESKNFALEQSFGFLMGIFGSAYTLNAADVLRIYFNVTQEELRPFKLKWPDQKDLEKMAANTLIKLFKQSPTWATQALGHAKTVLKNIKNPAKAWTYFKKTLKESLVTTLDKLKGPIIATILAQIPDVSIAGKKLNVTTARVAPAQVPNPFFRYTGVSAWLSSRQNLTFVDAGIDENIPLEPLFDPERKLSLILVGDASGDVPEGFLKLKTGAIQMQLALKNVYDRYGIDYILDTAKSNNVVQVYRPKQTEYPKASGPLKDVHPPVIIYINFIKDPMLLAQAEINPVLKDLIAQNELETFDAYGCLKDFCGTFNFNYSPKEVKQVSGIAEFNVKINQSLIIDVLDEIIERTRTDVHEWGGH